MMEGASSSQRKEDDEDHQQKTQQEMECSIYQNYGAEEVFIQGLAGIVNQQDVESMIRAQKKMLQRFEKTNEMLSNCNSLSGSRLERANKDFHKHISHLNEVKKDLEFIFKKVRSIKTKMAKNNSDAFLAVGGSFEPVKEEDDEYDVAIKKKLAEKDSKRNDTPDTD